jgi:restriction endonuclease S subunit
LRQFSQLMKRSVKSPSEPERWGLALDRIKTIQIPLPAIKDQTRIVSELDTREQRIRELQAAIIQAEQQKSAILEKYLK